MSEASNANEIGLETSFGEAEQYGEQREDKRKREREGDVPLMIRFIILCLVGVGGIS